MRFLHTSDWHVGRTLRGRSRLEEHEAVRTEVLDIAIRERIDCLAHG
jgi:exonuclease SbcD